MEGFKSLAPARHFLTTHAAFYNNFNFKPDLNKSPHMRHLEQSGLRLV